MFFWAQRTDVEFCQVAIVAVPDISMYAAKYVLPCIEGNLKKIQEKDA